MPKGTTLNSIVENKCMLCSENHDTEFYSKTIEENKCSIMMQGRCFLCFKYFTLLNIVRLEINIQFVYEGIILLFVKKAGIKWEKIDALYSSIITKNITQNIYFPTATALSIGNGHKPVLCLLYDLGLQRSFLFSSVAEKLGLQVLGEKHVMIHTFSSKTTFNHTQKRYWNILKNPEMVNKVITIELL